MSIPFINLINTPESVHITKLRHLIENTLDKGELAVKIQELYCEYYNENFASQVDNYITRSRIECFKRDFKINLAEMMSNRYYNWKRCHWSEGFMAELNL